jgi:hypothetical protein
MPTTAQAPQPTTAAATTIQNGESAPQIIPIISQPERPTMTASGVRAGAHLPDKIRQQIITDRYVDFRDIVRPAPENAYTMSLGGSTDSPMLSFTPRRKSLITYEEWCTAWDDFLAKPSDSS